MLFDGLLGSKSNESEPAVGQTNAPLTLIDLLDVVGSIPADPAARTPAASLPEIFEQLTSSCNLKVTKRPLAKPLGKQPKALPSIKRATPPPPAPPIQKSGLKGIPLPSQPGLKTPTLTPKLVPPVKEPASKVTANTSPEPPIVEAPVKEVSRTVKPTLSSAPKSIFSVNYRKEQTSAFFQSMQWQRMDPDAPELVPANLENQKSKQILQLNARQFFSSQIDWSGGTEYQTTEYQPPEELPALADFMGMATHQALETAREIKSVQSIVGDLPEITDSEDSAAHFFTNMNWAGGSKSPVASPPAESPTEE